MLLAKLRLKNYLTGILYAFVSPKFMVSPQNVLFMNSLECNLLSASLRCNSIDLTAVYYKQEVCLMFIRIKIM